MSRLRLAVARRRGRPAPSSTPAAGTSDRRPGPRPRPRRAGRAAAPARRASPRSRVTCSMSRPATWLPRDVLALDGVVPERLGEPRDDRVDHRGASPARAPSSARHRRDAAVADAARDDVVEHREVGIDVEREAVPRAAARRPSRRSPRSSRRRPTRRCSPAIGAASMPKSASTAIEHLPRAGARTRRRRAAPSRHSAQRDDRVADELTRAVVRDVAAAVGAARARRRRRAGGDQHVRRDPRASRACRRAGARAGAGSRRPVARAARAARSSASAYGTRPEPADPQRGH